MPGLCWVHRVLTHLIQAPKSSLPHFTDKESKAQRYPVVWQPQEPALPLNCQAPQANSPSQGLQERRKSPSQRRLLAAAKMTYGLINKSGWFRPPHQRDPGKTQGLPLGLWAPSTSTGVGRLRAVSDTDVCRQHPRTACRSSRQSRVANPQEAGLYRPQRPLPDKTATPTKMTSS